MGDMGDYYNDLKEIRRDEREKFGIPCPRCNNPQEPQFVARFGGCGACSQPLISEAPKAGVAKETPPG